MNDAKTEVDREERAASFVYRCNSVCMLKTGNELWAESMAISMRVINIKISTLEEIAGRGMKLGGLEYLKEYIKEKSYQDLI